MSEPTPSPPPPGASGAGSTEDLQTALFLDLVAQQAEMALMFLGRVPHPQTGQKVQDLETARLFISQLEMLEAKTKGNLNQREQSLLKQSLMATRLAFVEAVEAPPSKPEGSKESVPDPANASGQPAAAAFAATETPPQAQENATSAPEDDVRKKFVKKY